MILDRSIVISLIVAVMMVSPYGRVSSAAQTPSRQDLSPHCFVIRVVDQDTGRGVPLVELRTTNKIRYFTDSHGVAAFLEPGLMDTDVFFHIDSPGYEYPKDGFGNRGKRFKTTPGQQAVIKLKRLNIAERLYRVTGQGIYRDSTLAGLPVPLENPNLNGRVMGQDSVFTCLYRGRLFWMWGDTARPRYPLGHFKVSGAFSEMPARGGLAPEVGVDLEYIVGEDGFSRPVAPLKEPGLVWLDGLMTVQDDEGRQKMVARFIRLKSMAEVLEHGFVLFDDETQSFKPIVRSALDLLPFSNTAHAFCAEAGGDTYYYLTTPSPLGVRLRVKAQWDCVTDPNRYEVLTALGPKHASSPAISLARMKTPYRWVTFGDMIDSTTKAEVIKEIESEVKSFDVYDLESGQKVLPHNGTVYFNPYRNRWIATFVQQYGKSSYLGEVWYAEADTPTGPWCYARKIVTHNKYSFYNPKHHPLFDKDGGRTIFFEGTYSFTFSGSLETATPRYDYNQIMYQLDLSDQRMELPVPVYQVRTANGGTAYLLRDQVEEGNMWNEVEAIPFYAIEPDRASDDLVPIYAVRASQSKQSVLLTAEQPEPSIPPLFFALPPDEPQTDNPRIAALYEYRNGDSAERTYSTKSRLDGEAGKLLCRVWKAPDGVLLLDGTAKPSSMH